jgi:hypothetical protein
MSLHYGSNPNAKHKYLEIIVLGKKPDRKVFDFGTNCLKTENEVTRPDIAIRGYE